MKNKHASIAKQIVLLTGIVVTIVLQSQNGFTFNEKKIFFAGDSGATWCRETSTGPDRSMYSLFGLLRQSPPPGFAIEPDRDIPSELPCSISNSGGKGYGGLKILDWYNLCTDATGTGTCCFCFDISIDQSDAKYVILELAANDLRELYWYYSRDVDLVVEQAKALTTHLTGQGRKVIWISSAPNGYGSFGGSETACTDELACLNSLNSNKEYFYSKFIPWLDLQEDVYFIDFFKYVKNTYGVNNNFINQYGFDNIHLKPAGHQIYYDFVYGELEGIVGTAPLTTSTSVLPTTSTSTTQSTATTIQPTTTTTVSEVSTTTTSAGAATTVITTTTTTGGGNGPCPAKKVLGEDNPKLEQLRDLRDSRLAQCDIGRRVINIYYSYADSINAALERSPALRATARRGLEIIAPMAGRK